MYDPRRSIITIRFIAATVSTSFRFARSQSCINVQSCLRMQYVTGQTGDATQPFVLYGASGCGKTSLLAKAFSKVGSGIYRARLLRRLRTCNMCHYLVIHSFDVSCVLLLSPLDYMLVRSPNIPDEMPYRFQSSNVDVLLAQSHKLNTNIRIAITYADSLAATMI